MGRINKMAFSLGAITTISISIAFNTDAQQVESFRASTNITPQVESFQITKCGNLTPSLYTGAMTYHCLSTLIAILTSAFLSHWSTTMTATK